MEASSYGEKIENNSIVFNNAYHEDTIDSFIWINHNKEFHYVDEFDVPYPYTVLYNVREGESTPDAIEISNVEELCKVIDKEDCLPDIGLLDYKDDDLGLDLKDKTLREIYKAIFEKIGLIH